MSDILHLWEGDADDWGDPKGDQDVTCDVFLERVNLRPENRHDALLGFSTSLMVTHFVRPALALTSTVSVRAARKIEHLPSVYIGEYRSGVRLDFVSPVNDDLSAAKDRIRRAVYENRRHAVELRNIAGNIESLCKTTTFHADAFASVKSGGNWGSHKHQSFGWHDPRECIRMKEFGLMPAPHSQDTPFWATW